MKSRKDIIVALAGGSLSLAFTFLLKDNFNIIAATVAAAFVGVCLDDEA
jgi:uncharacterized membrane protein YjjB (DUF3815 family)